MRTLILQVPRRKLSLFSRSEVATPEHLSEFQPGQQASIVRIADSRLNQRLLSMGLLEGDQVEIRFNRQGSVVIAKNTLRLALGKPLACRIEATPVIDAQ